MKKYIILTMIIFGVNQIKSSAILDGAKGLVSSFPSLSFVGLTTVSVISGYVACNSLRNIFKKRDISHAMHNQQQCSTNINGQWFQVRQGGQLYQQQPATYVAQAGVSTGQGMMQGDRYVAVQADQVATVLNSKKQWISLAASTAVFAGSLWVLKRAIFS